MGGERHFWRQQSTSLARCTSTARRHQDPSLLSHGTATPRFCNLCNTPLVCGSSYQPARCFASWGAGRRHGCGQPHFLARCHGVIVCTCFKTGLGLAWEHGRGVLLARLACSSGTEHHHQWSAPCFVRSHGLSVGITAGLQASRHLVGLLSQTVLHWSSKCRTLQLGAELSVCLGSMER